MPALRGHIQFDRSVRLDRLRLAPRAGRVRRVEPSPTQLESTTGFVIRDAKATDVEAITEIQNALITSAAMEWTDVTHDVDERLTG